MIAKGTAPKERRAPTALQALSRWLLGLWWLFIIALGGSVASYLGNHDGPLVATSIPQFLVVVGRAPLAVQAGLWLVVLTLLIIAATLTWFAWVERRARAAEEAETVIADQKVALGQALDDRRIGPQLVELSEQSQQVGEQASEIHDVVVASAAKTDTAVAVATEARDIAKEIAERQNRPMTPVAGVPLTLIRDLRRETFKLGDDVAANFPYIREPTASAFAEAVQALHTAASHLGAKRGLLVLGEANAGKTRLAVESLIEALPDWEILRWSEARLTVDILRTEVLTDHNVVLFVDDVQNYAGSISPSGETGLLASSTAGATLRTLWELLRNRDGAVVLVATCRTEDEKATRASLGWLWDELTVLTARSFSPNGRSPESADIISRFGAHGTVQRDAWDGTLGSLVLGLQRKREKYEALNLTNNVAAYVLRSMKLLTIAGIFRHTSTRVRTVCADIFGQSGVLAEESEWNNAVEELLRLEFVSEERQLGELALVIRKDSYFDAVVTDYPNPKRPQQFLEQRTRLNAVFIRLQDAPALLGLAHGWIRAADHTQAMAALQESVHIDPNQAGAWGLIGGMLLMQSRTEEALAASERALSLDPNTEPAWVAYSGALLGLGRTDEALAASENIKVQLEAAWMIKSAVFLDKGQLDKALEASERAVRLAPRIGFLWEEYANMLFKLERYDEALAAYEQALRLDPSEADWWACKGDVLGELKHYEEALAAYEQALRLNPSQAIWWARKGAAHYNLKRYTEAIKAYERALERDPSRGRWWTWKGEALQKLNKYEAALAAFDRSVTLDPSDSRAREERTWILIEHLRRRYDEALEDCERAIGLDPMSVYNWSLRGDALAGLGRVDAARDAFLHAISLPAEGSLYKGHRARCFSRLGRHDEALEAIEQSLELSPHDDTIWREKGRILYLPKRYQEALPAFDQALALDSSDPDTWEDKATTLRALGREDEARQAEEQALALREQPM